MSEPKWSKGEWEKQYGIPYVNCGDVGPVFGPIILGVPEEEMDACAQLMATALELYEALANLIPRFEKACALAGSDDEYVRLATEKARAVLAKARGETP